jgi:uridine kinase
VNVSLETIVVALHALPRRDAPVFVGISGFGGSGKSTFAQELAARLGESEIVPMDNFWRPEFNVRSSDWVAYDRERLIELVLRPAKRGKTIHYQMHDWETGTPGSWRTVSPASFLLIEGISALHPNLFPYYDYTVWVDCPLETAEARGLQRDYPDGRDETQVWTTIWTPNERDYFAKYRPDRLADARYKTG